MRRNQVYPLSLTDRQLKTLMDAAQPLTPDQRHSFLLRVESRLKLSRINSPSDDLLAKCVQSALDEVAA